MLVANKIQNKIDLFQLIVVASYFWYFMKISCTSNQDPTYIWFISSQHEASNVSTDVHNSSISATFLKCVQSLQPTLGQSLVLFFYVETSIFLWMLLILASLEPSSLQIQHLQVINSYFFFFVIFMNSNIATYICTSTYQKHMHIN